jgi:U3 small nucleolar RNA-associated protein 14
MSSLEAKIQEIMQESGLGDKNIAVGDKEEQAFEELQEKKVSLIEQQARRAELRQARDLLFREEIRAKRIKKIKSKAYRRIHRKERDRATMREHVDKEAQGLIDSEEEREKSDRRRAEERMGARHRESKWAKAAKATGRAAWDEQARDSVGDLARRDEELRRRIEGRERKGSDFSESESASDGYDSEMDREKLESEFAALERPSNGDESSKLQAMGFMKRAEAARKATNDIEIRRIRQQLAGQGEEEGQGDVSSSEIESVVGHQKFGGVKDSTRIRSVQVPVDKSEFEEMLSDDEQVELAVTGESQKARPPKSDGIGSDVVSGRQPRLKQTARDFGAASKLQPVNSTKIERSQVRQEGSSRSLQSLETPRQAGEFESDADDDGDEMESQTEEGHEGPRTLSEAIFFGDDTLQRDFEDEKRKAVMEEDDEVVDDPNALPGWGSWTGAGISKKVQKKSLARLKQRLQAGGSKGGIVVKGVKPEQRKDRGLERVIVNEKLVKKSNLYLATELPHPYENRGQYERSLRLPVGPEWTTKKDFQDAVKPRVLLKQGVIRPINRPAA